MSDPNPSIPSSPAAPAAATPPVTSTAPKPAAPAAKAPPKKGADWRGFLSFFSWIGLAWAMLTASTGVLTLGTVRFLFPNVLSEPPSKVKVGFPDAFDEGKVVESFKDKNIWVVKYQGKLIALSTTCTHLGCTPNYLEKEGKFKCPCHGSGFCMGSAFDGKGINCAGPATRPLDRAHVELDSEGQIVVNTNKLYQWPENGRSEFDDPGAHILLPKA
ncbi:MAG TPA: ubiquinol-cytochrome c reductase iron-sulfur subunit [Pyrinomonadaceae bacterium]|nr:ubiquinol-cytochrome c reductase iron-sulfur subunit [Pyrinomonadaceae bacterium]